MHIDDARHFVPLAFGLKRLEVGALELVVPVACDLKIGPAHVHVADVELAWAKVLVLVLRAWRTNNRFPHLSVCLHFSIIIYF